MATDPSAEANRDWPASYMLRCATCARELSATPEKVRGYAGTGWPMCCGGAMGYFAVPARPGTGAAAPDKPALGAPDDTSLGRAPLPPE